MNYAAGYGMAVMSFVQVFYMCELGDSIEVVFIQFLLLLN